MNAGVGIDVFSNTANGSVAPTRIIPLGGATTLSIAQYIAVDSLGNIYVSNLNSNAQFTVAVFGPTANGNVAPDHILNQFASGLAVDGSNNLYVLGVQCWIADNRLRSRSQRQRSPHPHALARRGMPSQVSP